MLDFVASILQIMFIVFLIRTVFALVSTMVLSKKLRDAYNKNEELKKNEYTAVRRAVETGSPRDAANAPEMVQDEVCGRYIPREKAYITMADGIRHYFCSWECRQKYIQG